MFQDYYIDADVSAGDGFSFSGGINFYLVCVMC